MSEPGGTPYNGLYAEVSPERGTFFRLQVYARVGILFFEVYEWVGKFVIWVCERAQMAERIIIIIIIIIIIYGFITSWKCSLLIPI